jgi:prepilin-type N-terminal cleavage/methylation domain-containing protein
METRVTKVTEQRGMTLIEMVISFAILLLVLGFATALFKQAFTHNTLTQENMSNEQLARVAIANINSSLSQASEDVNPADLTPTPPGTGTPAPAVIGIDTFPTPPGVATQIAFYRVQSLAPPASLTVGSVGNPVPNYNVHVISYDPIGKTVNECVTSVANYQATGTCTAPVTQLAGNVTDFELQQIAGDKYEYRMSITVNNIINTASGVNAEAPYTLVDNVHMMR